MTDTRCLARVVIVAVLVWGGEGRLAAQEPAGPRPPLQVRGQVGTYSELYGMSGTDPRRPPESARVMLTPTLVLWGRITVPVNLMLTTESGSSVGLHGISGRQRLNQIGLHPDWGWGRLDLGSFSGSYTARTWSGVRVDGAGIDLHPGIVQAGIFGGSARQAVYGGAETGSYARTIMGGRLGLGRTTRGVTGTFFDVMFVRAWDDPASLTSPSDTIPAPRDTAIVSPDSLLPPVTLNPYAVTPQDNLVLGASGGVSLLGDALRWRGEIDGSLYTRDRRASPLAPETLHDYPGILQDIVQPRIGTNADYAWSTELQVRVARLPGATPRSPRSLNATIAYRFVGPGYTSLGTESLFNDVQGLDVKTSARFRRWSLQLGGSWQHDNLVGQKLGTTTRQRSDAAFNFLVSRRWTATIRGAYATMANDVSDPSQRLDYTTGMIATTQTFTLRRGGLLRSIAVDYTYQGAGDANPLRASTRLRSHRADARVTVAAAPNLTLAPSLGLASSATGDSAGTIRATYGLSAQWRALAGRLSSSATVARSDFGRSTSMVANLRAQYRLTAQDVVTLGARLNRYRFPLGDYPSFTERTVSLQWSRRL